MNKQALQKSVNSIVFHKAISIVIILCAVVLGVETMLSNHPNWQKPFVVIDILLTSIFIAEIIARLLAAKSIVHFFHLFSVKKVTGAKYKRRVYFHEDGFWNWFDFVITAISTIAIFTHFFEHSEYLLIGRLLRIFRIFRLLEVSSQLKEIEKKIASIIPTVFSFGLLLFILIYIYAIVGFYLFNGHKFGTANFSTLFDSIFTLFQVMTLDGWGEVMTDVIQMKLGFHPLIINIYFISFVVLTAIVSLNVFIAVLASGVETRLSRNLQSGRKSIIKLIKEEGDQTEEEVVHSMKLIMAEFKILRDDMKHMKEKIDGMDNK